MTAAVDNVHSIQGEAYPSNDIPKFEGNEVARTSAKVTSMSNLDIGDRHFPMDRIVRMVVEARVEGIGHDVGTDGKLIRVHRMRVVDSIIIDWTQDLEALREGLQ